MWLESGNQTVKNANLNLGLAALMEYSGLMMFGAMTQRQIFGPNWIMLGLFPRPEKATQLLW